LARDRFATAIDTRLTYPKNGPTMWSMTTKRAIRKANGSLRPRTNMALEIVEQAVEMECDWLGWGRCGRVAVVRTFIFFGDAGTPS